MRLRIPVRMVRCCCILALATTFLSPASGAEEITLQDGQKITGTVVGFENGMFKVETEFGFALVRKDKVKSISFSPAGAARAEERNGANAVAVLPTGPPAPEATAPTPKPTATKAPIATEARPVPPPPPVSRPLDQPLPAEIRERLEGTTYINETFHFSFFKPPGWKVHENTARETGRAIVAISPEDEHTLLFVDRQVWSGPPNLQSDATDANLRRTYQNYRTTAETSTQLAGRPAIRREFEGELDGAIWRGVAVRIAEGNTVFGLIGLTSAETLQFHQAVLNKIISSFRFLASDSATSANR